MEFGQCPFREVFFTQLNGWMEIGDVKTFGNVSIRSHDIGIKQPCQYVKGLLIHTCEAPHSSQWLAKTFETLSVSVHGLELEIPCQSIYSASTPLHGDQWRSEFLGLYKIETTGW